MLTVARCEQTALHSLGYEVLPVSVSALEIVTRTGRWLCSAHPWTWLTRLGTVDVTGSQLYASLSALGSVTGVVSVQFTDASAYYLREASLPFIHEQRTTNVIGGYPAYYALNNRISADGSLDKVLELDCVPNDDIAGGLSLLYRAGFQVPAAGDASARIAIPEEWEGLFSLAVVAVARGLMEEEAGTVDMRLGALKQSDEFKSLVRMDGMAQSNYGYLQGGGVAMQMAGTNSLRYPSAPASS